MIATDKVNGGSTFLGATEVNIPPFPPNNLDNYYRTELCSTEILFSGYICGLFTVAEKLSLEDRVFSKDIDQAIVLVRELRELTINQLAAHISAFPDGDNDPFFRQIRMPVLVAIRGDGFVRAAQLSLSAYLSRLSLFHPMFKYNTSLRNASELFCVAVSADGDDADKHFLVLPSQEKLLQAAKEGSLYSTISTY
jgi:hypothetical protein